MLLELQRRHEPRVVERLLVALEPVPPVRTLLHGVVDAIRADLAQMDDASLAREIMAMYVRHRPFVDPFTDSPLLVKLADALSEAAERGEVRNDIGPEELASLFLTGLFGCLVGAVDTMEDQRASFDRFIDVFVRGISP